MRVTLDGTLSIDRTTVERLSDASIEIGELHRAGLLGDRARTLSMLRWPSISRMRVRSLCDCAGSGPPALPAAHSAPVDATLFRRLPALDAMSQMFCTSGSRASVDWRFRLPKMLRRSSLCDAMQGCQQPPRICGIEAAPAPRWRSFFDRAIPRSAQGNASPDLHAAQDQSGAPRSQPLETAKDQAARLSKPDFSSAI